MPETDLLKILFDIDDMSTLTLYDEYGNEMLLQQVATIPYDDEVFAVVRPLSDEYADDEAIVCKVVTHDDESALVIEYDEDIAMEVFERYLDLLEN